jgi:hypothetical protein
MALWQLGKFNVGHIPEHWDGKAKKFVIKQSFETKTAAEKFKKECYKKLPSHIEVLYLTYSKKEVEVQWEQCSKESKEKAAAKRAQKKSSGEKVKRTFILCPRCKATSKLLYSEFGGLQTRRCKNGHTFEYDKWIGDRIGMAFIFGNPIKAAEFMVKYPVKIK